MKSLYMIRTMKRTISNRKIVLLAVVCCVSAFFIGCSNTQDRVKSIAEEHVELFASGEMEDINQIIFGVSELQEEIEIVEMKGSNMISCEGILSTFFSYSKVEVENVTKDSVKLKISAPDVSDLIFYFRKAPADFNIELTEYINAFVDKEEMKETIVSVSYIEEGEKIFIDYCNEEFINAITGGLFEVYREAYIDEVEEYREEVKK